jgi:hypothetical protein
VRCREFHDLLRRSRDERLESAGLEAHASSCPACARLLASEERLAASLARLRRRHDAVPAGLAARARRIAAARAPERRAFPALGLVALATAAAVFAAALVLSPASRDPRRAITAAAGGPSSELPAGTAAEPVLWSNGGVDVVAPAPDSAEPRPVAVLVEWNL